MPWRLLLLIGVGILAAPLQAEQDEPADWWSLSPLHRPEVPRLEGGGTEDLGLNVIDRFVIAKQRELGLTMSGEASRQTLIRRVYFDLIGLPPSPGDVRSFVHDEREGAYGLMVERLLASPRYGERWARHWLDVVHYGDTHGYDKDKLRPNAYPYRDYVIRSFNEDKNYTRFIREQLAGDVLWPGTVDGIVATGFIAAGPWDFIGHAEVPEEKIDGKVARHLDRDDMVATTLNTFCSLTVQCAQCHDHKRDPVSMEDYYRLQAVFSALDRADRPYDPNPETGIERKRLAEARVELQEEIKAVANSIDAMKSVELKAVEDEIRAIRERAESADGERSESYGYHSQVAKRDDVVKWVQVDLGQSLAIDELVIAPSDEYGFPDFGFPHRFRIEVSDDPEFASPRALVDHSSADYPRPGGGLILIDADQVSGRYVRVTATRLWNRRRMGEAESGDWIFALGELAVISAGKVVPVQKVMALDSIEALPRWGKRDLVDGVYGRNTIDPESLIASARDSAAQQGEKLEGLEMRRRELVSTDIDPGLLSRQDELRSALQEIAAALAALPKPQFVYAGTVHKGSGTFKGTGHDGGRPRSITVLARGDVTRPGEEVGPGAPALVPGVPAQFRLPAGHVEGDRRVALANWIAHPDNPLTWRAIVNRVWLYHFGRGIADSPNDFGRMGQPPTHPELLDWLAVEFRDGRQSIKALHRLIVNSATYRQSSRGNAVAERVDASNRFLWRMNRRKIEAEAIRDTMLHVAGKLDLTMYGPGYHDFVLEKTAHSPHYQYHKHDPDDPASHRRSVYRFLVRSQPAPFMDTLDCADPSLSVDKRNETLTALQALALLNNKFVLRMSEHFAAALENEREPMARAVGLALSREAEQAELHALQEYARRHGMAAACRLIFNLNEFAFVD